MSYLTLLILNMLFVYSIKSDNRFPKIIAVILYGSLTLKGEYGMPVWLDILFSVSNVSILDVILSLVAITALILVLLDVYKPKALKIWLTSWLVLLFYLIPYCNQSQEHVNPFSLKETFIWQALLLTIILTIVILNQANKDTMTDDARAR